MERSEEVIILVITTCFLLKLCPKECLGVNFCFWQSSRGKSQQEAFSDIIKRNMYIRSANI